MTKEEFKDARNQLGWSQEEMKRRLGGYTLRAVQSWEYGEREVPPAVAKLIQLYLVMR